MTSKPPTKRWTKGELKAVQLESCKHDAIVARDFDGSWNASNDCHLARMFGRKKDVRRANAARLVACWNAMLPYKDPAKYIAGMERVVEAAKQLRGTVWHSEYFKAMQHYGKTDDATDARAKEHANQYCAEIDKALLALADISKGGEE